MCSWSGLIVATGEILSWLKDLFSSLQSRWMKGARSWCVEYVVCSGWWLTSQNFPAAGLKASGDQKPLNKRSKRLCVYQLETQIAQIKRLPERGSCRRMELAGGLRDLKSGLMLNFAGISWLFWNTKLQKIPLCLMEERERRGQAATARQLGGACHRVALLWTVLLHRRRHCQGGDTQHEISAVFPLVGISEIAKTVHISIHKTTMGS